MSYTKIVLEAVQSMSQYDENAKMILADKEILANMLVRTVDEFLGMDPKKVELLIEGEPFIGSTPVEPGLTNEKDQEGNMVIHAMDHIQKCSVIKGMNVENKIRNEGIICFDILFYVRTKDELSKVIINLEAQKGEPSEYDVEMRGIFYASRELSSQLRREFSDQQYNEIKKVYSIWIVMNTKENTIDRIRLHKEDVLGVSRWKPMYELLNVIVIRMRNKLTEDTTQELHRLLGALFTEDLEMEVRCSVLEEFGIGMEENRKGMVKSMCNLGEGIWERGIEKGMEKGIQKGIEQGIEQERIKIAKALLDVMDISTIAKKTGLAEEEVRALATE